MHQQLQAPGLQLALRLPRRRQQRRLQCSAALPEAAQRALLDLAAAQPQQVAEVADGLEAPVQLIYLLTLLGFLVVGAYLVVRQVPLAWRQTAFTRLSPPTD